MTIQKFTPKTGVNKENTRLFNEGGWWECNRVRFRQGTPQQIGGWAPWSLNTFLGVCRTLKVWATLAGTVLLSLGTHLKALIANGGSFYDITPARVYTQLSGPFAATPGSATVTVTSAAHGAVTGDCVTFYNAAALSTQTFTTTIASPAVLTLTSALANNTPVVLSTTGALPTGLVAGTTYYVINASGTTCNLANNAGGAAINTSGTQSGTHSLYVNAGATAAVLNTTFQVTVTDVNHYTITLPVNAGTYDTGSGGTAVTVIYDIAAGAATTMSSVGFGAGTFGSGTWGVGSTGTTLLRIWNMSSFGQDLILGIRGAALYYWNSYYGPLQQTVSVTIASPGVLTLSFAPTNGMALVLFTTGTLPTGLTAGTVYYVVNASGLTCNLATTYGGSAINTGGTQSGTHYLSQRALPLASLANASDVPTIHNFMLVSDTTRFVLVFGVNPIGQSTIDPMFVRWSDQESVVNWTPTETNQAGGYRLSRGSKIMGVLQAREEVIVWTDNAVYSAQYLGPPYVWGFKTVGTNTSLMTANTVVDASGTVYWMGTDKFYKYNGRVDTLRCDLRQYVYDDINMGQSDQFFAGTVEAFDEVWFFYCSASSTTINRYVVYNYVEDCWYHGAMNRTAWNDAKLLGLPMGATYNSTLVYQETGNDDNETGTANAMGSYILSSEFDIGDGDKFGFIWRVIPDLNFTGSTGTNPSVTLTLNALANSGSGYNSPASQGGSATGSVTRTATAPVEQYTGQVNIRIRGRQMSMRVDNANVGTAWQLGATRLDVRTDGRKG